ncbi:hypothetical protein HON36_01960 [Candidatus Parcubacteria bacterium]|jgi:hypothetical protein|nr:hypothetical protein [Candidatus Parcubacteria bacterium]MBT7228441.1 hypothetical protein [Candidatus Parcubacteria bacterium]
MDDYKPISTRELERGYYLLTHREQLKKIGAVGLLAVVLIIYVILAINTIAYASSDSYASQLTRIETQTDWATYHQQRKPMELNRLFTKYLSLGEGKYNFVTFLENPNTDWAAIEIEYEFTINGQSLGIEKTFLNPGETRLVVRFGYEDRGTVSNLDVNIIGTKWRRFENDVPIINWDIKNAEYTPTSNVAVGSDDSLVIPANVKWQAQNLSVYDFWEVDFIIAVFNGENLVGVNKYKARDFMSLEDREMEVFWTTSLSRINKIEVWPVLNGTDFDNYKESYITPGGSDRVRL